MKSISKINLVITENVKCLIIKTCPAIINQNSGCICSITVYHYASFPATSNTLGSIQSNDFPKSHTEAIMCIPKIIYVVVEKGMEHKGEQR